MTISKHAPAILRLAAALALLGQGLAVSAQGVDDATLQVLGTKFQGLRAVAGAQRRGGQAVVPGGAGLQLAGAAVARGAVLVVGEVDRVADQPFLAKTIWRTSMLPERKPASQ